MTQYLMSVCTPADGVQPAPEKLDEIMADVGVVHRELQAQGAWVFGGGLEAPSTATVVRVADGETLLTDGPFIESKEYIGGFSIIDVEDLDAALEWARKLTAAIGLPIEVRPFQREQT